MAWSRSKSAQTPAWSQDDYHTDFAAKIKDQIEQGVAPWQEPWLPDFDRRATVMTCRPRQGSLHLEQARHATAGKTAANTGQAGTSDPDLRAAGRPHTASVVQ